MLTATNSSADASSVPAQPSAAAGASQATPPSSPDSPETLSVTQVEPAASATDTNLSGAQLQALPTSGRHWEDFLLQAPAATTAPGAAGISVGSAGLEAADTTIDGASTRMAFGGAAGSVQPSPDDAEGGTHDQEAMGSGWSGRTIAVSESAVKAVRVLSGNALIEGAHAAGGRTSIETERGGNLLSGQAHFYDRQNTWGARNPFSQWVQNIGTAAAPNFAAVPFTPPDHELAWGWGAGGRIRRDKLFWYGAFDGYGRNDPGVASVKNFAEMFAPVEPTSASVVLLSAQLGETQNQAYDDYMGIPRGGVQAAGLEQLAALLGPAARTASQWTGFGRADWEATERHKFSLEASAMNSNAPGGGQTRVTETYGNRSFGARKTLHENVMANWEAFLTPNLLAVTQGSVRRTTMSAGPETPSAFEQTLLNGSAFAQLPQIIVDSRYGFSIGNPARFGKGDYPDEHLYSAQETLSWVKGRVLVRAGAQFDHNTDAITLLRNATGTFHYTKLESFISDASAYERFGTLNLFNYQNPHNCNATGKGLGALPCYSYFTQTLGPTFWQVNTNDLAGFVTAQWQLSKWAVASAGLRWDYEQLPPPMKLVDNPALPLTEKLPDPGGEWGPRVSLAIGNRKHWPVLRLGYGMYFGRTTNATLLSAITQTGSLKGDLSIFIRPTDGLNSSTGTSAAPPFPNPLTGLPGSLVVPGAVEYAPSFRNPEIHQAIASVEQRLPANIQLTASAMVSLGRRLPISIDTNFDAAVNPKTITYAVKDATGKGPLKSSQITVPFYALWPAADCNGATLTTGGQCGRTNPSYQQITEITSRSNSTYEAAIVRLERTSARGLTVNAHYTYSHAMDWSPNESTLVAGSDVLDPADFKQEYGPGNLDVRHSAAVMFIYEVPWKLKGVEGGFANGWMISGTGQFHSGLPYSMRTAGYIPEETDVFGNPTIVGIGPGMNGSGGDNRVYGVGRNTFRYPDTWKADVRLGKKFSLGEKRELELLAESFNFFNHSNVTQLETTGYEIEPGSAGTMPTLTYMTEGTTGTAATTPAFGQPRNVNGTNLYRERQIELGARLRF